MLTDNGTQFTAKLWKETMQQLGINVTHTTRYHPQSNSVERYNREIGRLLRTYCIDQHAKWPLYLQVIESWMNKLKSEVTEKTPTQILKGVQPTSEIEKMVQFPLQPTEPTIKDEICVIADRIKNKAEKREQKANKNRTTKIYTEGQLVLIKNHQLSNADQKEIKKLFNLFEGPYQIKKLIGDTTLVVVNLENNKEELVNTKEVRPYYRATSPNII